MKKLLRKRPIVGFTLPSEITDGLRALKVRDGISHSEAVARAVRRFLVEKSILKKAE